MDQEMIAKVQPVFLEIAREVRRVCEENQISYFLAAGTCLGAIRHDGFIPWDDDLDIGMLRADYERFREIAPKKLKPEYVFQDWHTDSHYGLPFGKVRKRGTLYLESKSNRLEENGFYVDIFPYDFWPESEEAYHTLRKKQMDIYRMKLMKEGYQPWKENEKTIWKKRLGYIFYQLRALAYRQDALTARYEALSRDIRPNHLVYEHYPEQTIRRIEKAWLEETVPHVFAGDRFPVPSNADGYLRALYGDYMVLPPEDQRENRHQIYEIDFGGETK